MSAEAEAEAAAMRMADASMTDPFSIIDGLDGVTDGVQNTKDVRSSALQLLNKFLQDILQNPSISFESMESADKERICSEKVLNAFANYMANKETESTSGMMKPGTAKTFLSAVKTYLMKQNPNHEIWKDTQWYSEIYQALGTSLSRKYILKGLNIQDKAPPLGWVMLGLLMDALMYRDDRQAYLCRAILAEQYTVAGRGGESGIQSWNTCYWDREYSARVHKWGESKTGKQPLMPIYSTYIYESYKNCSFHSMACYMILGGCKYPNVNERLKRAANNDPNFDHSQWIFPDLAGYANGCSEKVTEMIRSLVHPDNLPRNRESQYYKKDSPTWNW